MPVGRIEGLNSNSPLFQVSPPLQSRVEVDPPAVAEGGSAQAEAVERLESSPREVPASTASVTDATTDQDAVVLDLTRAKADDPDFEYPTKRPEDLQEETGLYRASDFYAAEALPVLAADGGEDATEELEQVAPDNSANISRVGAEAAPTQLLNENGIKGAELVPANQLETQAISGEVENKEQGQKKVVSGDEAREEKQQEQKQKEAENKEVQELKQRDSEVRRHEQAHKATLGSFSAGGISYDYQRGPNGVQYAVGGSVPVDVSEEATPDETIRKAQTIKRSALAPAEPSGADRQVAAQASQLEASARQELRQLEQEEREEKQSEDSGTGSASIVPGIAAYQRSSAGVSPEDGTGSIFAAVL